MSDTAAIHPVILCGGSGTRLWPLSRKTYPKQFAPLLGENSLYQATLLRSSGPKFAPPLVMTAEDFRFMAIEQAEAIGLMDARVVVEPMARDTAPAILAAALMLEDRPDDLMLVMPSDHIMQDPEAFQAAIGIACEAAGEGALVTFGVTPDHPETGYGYLQLAGSPDGVTSVTKFTEKPDLKTAQAMLEAGHYLWNAGIFMGRVKDFIAAFSTHAPALIDPVRAAVSGAVPDLNFMRLDAGSFANASAISIDYAIMEKADWVVAVPLDCGWSDMGSWNALWEIAPPDSRGNATSGEVIAMDCKDSYLKSAESSMVLVGLGLDNVIAVAMRDAVLVADKSRAQEVKGIVETLRRAEKAQADDYPRFHRPWGWYETLCLAERFQVKRIMVKPGGVLSLQSHRHRSEHWIVVAGTAEVTIGDEVKLVSENQGVYIPLGEKHRMANPGKVPMYLIEVQTGAYLREDDIVRYEDIYDRS